MCVIGCSVDSLYVGGFFVCFFLCRFPTIEFDIFSLFFLLVYDKEVVLFVKKNYTPPEKKEILSFFFLIFAKKKCCPHGRVN